MWDCGWCVEGAGEEVVLTTRFEMSREGRYYMVRGTGEVI